MSKDLRDAVSRLREVGETSAVGAALRDAIDAVVSAAVSERLEDETVARALADRIAARGSLDPEVIAREIISADVL